ncbi:glycosyltransferase family 4 protein [Pseudoclavibacter helvolus]|uniref:glycosyltransferase family 4 protein n=1 Tax=Pseudoclavibacter helvolus TaxID=255205 RepID=UPI003C71F877
MRHAKPVALWVVPVSALGGVARHVLDAAGAGIPGYELVVLTPEGPLVAELQKRGIRVAVGAFGPDAGVAASIRTLRTAAARLRPAVVHSHLSYADVIVAAAPLPKNTIRVTTEHGIAGDDRVYHGNAAKSRLMAAVHSTRLRRFDAVIAVSEATKQAMIEKWAPRQEIQVILNGVDSVESNKDQVGSESSALRILALARLSPEKRIPQLLRAFHVVLESSPDAHLTVAGIGDLEAELKALARELGIERSVTFPGFVDPDEAMSEADVLAQLSVWENCSYSLLDAANRGMRVVASNVGGNPEIVDPRGLVDADDIGGVARALLDPDAATRLDNWPTVRDMTALVAAVYQGSGARSAHPEHRGSITLATNNGDLGGGEVMLLSLARMLRSLDVDVTVVGPSEPHGLIDAARAQGETVVELDATDRRSWMLSLRAWDAKHRRGLLWCNGLVPAAATAGHPDRLVHLHLLPSGVVQKSLAVIARWRTLATLVPSEWMRAQVPGAETLQNWTGEVALVGPRASETGVTVLGFLGRPSVGKGVDVLARALRQLDGADPGAFRLRIGGEPFFVSRGERDAVEAALKSVEPLVDRVGWVDRDEFLGSIDLLVVPSVWPETFGLVVAEAMAAGVPVIVSDAGALPEILGDNGDVFASNDVAALVRLVLQRRAEGAETRREQNRVRWESLYSPTAAAQRVGRLVESLRV